MDADEDRILGCVRDPGPHVERVGFLVAERARGAFVKSAVPGIEHYGLDFAAALDHLRTELWLDGFREIDAGDEKLVVVGDDRETEPVADAVDDGFAAVEGDLELVPAVIKDDRFAGGIDVAEEAVELGDV